MASPNSKGNRRNKFRFVIKHKMQLRYAIVMLTFAGISCVVVGGTIFFTGWELFGGKLAELYPQGRFNALIFSINMALLRNVLLILPAVFLLSYYFSHKIAGPLYRIEQTLKEVGRGRLDFKIKFRKGDELRELETSINDMIQNLDVLRSRDSKNVLEFCNKTEELISSLNKVELPADIADKIKVIQKEMTTMKI